MKAILRFFIFISVFFLLGCAVTKRKYTGGFYTHWHSKSPQVLGAAKNMPPHNVSDKVTQPISLSEKKVLENETGNNIEQPVMPPFTKTYKETRIFKNISDKITASYIVSSRKSTTENSETPDDSGSKRDMRISWLFCLLGFLGGLFLIALLVIIGSSFSGGAVGIINNYPELLVIILLLPLISFIVSLIHSFRAMKGGHHLGLISIVVLDIIGIIISFFLIISLFINIVI